MQLEARLDTSSGRLGTSIRKFALETSFRLGKHLAQKRGVCFAVEIVSVSRVFIRREQERKDSVSCFASSSSYFLIFFLFLFCFLFSLFFFLFLLLDSLCSLYLVCSIAFVVFAGGRLRFPFPPILRLPLPCSPLSVASGARSPSLDKSSSFYTPHN